MAAHIINEHFTKAMMALYQKERFYFYFVLNSTLERRDSIPTMGVCCKNNKINLVYNLDFINKLSVEHLCDILIHEMEHVVRGHIQLHVKTRALGSLRNVAMDVEINQKIRQTAEELDVWLPEKVAEMIEHKVPVKEGMLQQYYYDLMKEHGKRSEDGESGYSLDDHDVMRESTGDADSISDAIRSSVEKAAGQARGRMSSDLKSLIDQILQPKINWKQKLKMFAQNAIKTSFDKTRSKRNRRYGIKYAGKRNKYKCELAICIDTSGSMSDSDLQEVHAELVGIHRQGIKMIVIQCDSAVKNVAEEFDPNKPFLAHGRGGTLYQPAIDAAMEHSPNGIIYFGDFDSADTPADPKIPFLWVGNNANVMPPATFGKVTYIR